MTNDEPQRLTPKPMTKSELLALIDEVRELIVNDDSWEGLINWLMPDPAQGDDDGVDFRVEARYRIGNSQGQGGIQIVGDWINKSGHVIRHVDPQRGLG
jgi:hypothetical protein